MSRMLKKNFSLPEDYYHDIEYIAQRLGISRSSALVNLTQELITNLAWKLRADIPRHPSTEMEMVRYRGNSQDVVHERIEKLRRITNDLFSQQ